MELSTRRVEIGGIASRANGLWMAQVARNLTDGVDGFFEGKRRRQRLGGLLNYYYREAA